MLDLRTYAIALMTIEHDHDLPRQHKIRAYLARFGYEAVQNRNDDFFFRRVHLARLSGRSGGIVDPLTAFKHVCGSYGSNEPGANMNRILRAGRKLVKTGPRECLRQLCRNEPGNMNRISVGRRLVNTGRFLSAKAGGGSVPKSRISALPHPLTPNIPRPRTAFSRSVISSPTRLRRVIVAFHGGNHMIALSDLIKRGEDRVVRQFLHNHAPST